MITDMTAGVAEKGFVLPSVFSTILFILSVVLLLSTGPFDQIMLTYSVIGLHPPGASSPCIGWKSPVSFFATDSTQ